MHASGIVRQTLAPVLAPMHACRRRVLLQAVEALIAGRRLTLTDLARSWPGAVWMHAPLKALDRLLSNRHVHRVLPDLYRAMSAWLLRDRRPVLVVDWSDLKGDGRWCLLRAAVPKGSRAVTVYERIYPLKQLNSPRAQAAFLDDLARALPATCVPILVTDAGFRSDWFRAVAARGWEYLGRVRNNVQVRQAGTDDWQPCADLFEGAHRRAEELGAFDIVKGQPWACRLVRVRRLGKQREQLTRKGLPQQGAAACKARKRAREPWLLATSLDSSDLTPARLVALYGQRMQIEQSFRDLKSHHVGFGLEDSQSRHAPRLAVLLLLSALATFAAWLLACALERTPPAQDPLTAQRKHRARYSPIRRALEWLRRPSIPPLDLNTLWQQGT